MMQRLKINDFFVWHFRESGISLSDRSSAIGSFEVQFN